MEGMNGSVLFFKKNGQATKNFPLSVGETTMGSSLDADVRLKIEDSRLESIHCILDAKDNGLVHIVNKSTQNPVKVNDKPVHNQRVLYHEDMIEVPGKSFQYLHHNIDKEMFANAEKELKKLDFTYVPRLTSVKKPATSRISSTHGRTPQKSGIKKPLFSTPKPTPTINRSKLLQDKSKTISRVIISKTKKSPLTMKTKRRLSLCDTLAKSTKSPRISSRNLLLSSKLCKEIATPASKTTQKTPKKVSVTPAKTLQKTPKRVSVTPAKAVFNTSLAKTPQNKRLEALKQQSSRKTPIKTIKESPKSPVSTTPSKKGRFSKSLQSSPKIEVVTSPLTPSKRVRTKKSIATPVTSEDSFNTEGESITSPNIPTTTESETPSKKGRQSRKSIGTPLLNNSISLETSVSPSKPNKSKIETNSPSVSIGRTPKKSLGKTPRKSVGRPPKKSIANTSISNNNFVSFTSDNVSSPLGPKNPTGKTPRKSMAKTPAKSMDISTFKETSDNVSSPLRLEKPTAKTPRKSMAKSTDMSTFEETLDNVSSPSMVEKTPRKSMAKTPAKSTVSSSTRLSKSVVETVESHDSLPRGRLSRKSVSTPALNKSSKSLERLEKSVGKTNRKSLAKTPAKSNDSFVSPSKLEKSLVKTVESQDDIQTPRKRGRMSTKSVSTPALNKSTNSLERLVSPSPKAGTKIPAKSNELFESPSPIKSMGKTPRKSLARTPAKSTESSVSSNKSLIQTDDDLPTPSKRGRPSIKSVSTPALNKSTKSQDDIFSPSPKTQTTDVSSTELTPKENIMAKNARKSIANTPAKSTESFATPSHVKSMGKTPRTSMAKSTESFVSPNRLEKSVVQIDDLPTPSKRSRSSIKSPGFNKSAKNLDSLISPSPKVGRPRKSIISSAEEALETSSSRSAKKPILNDSSLSRKSSRKSVFTDSFAEKEFSGTEDQLHEELNQSRNSRKSLKANDNSLSSSKISVINQEENTDVSKTSRTSGRRSQKLSQSLSNEDMEENLNVSSRSRSRRSEKYLTSELNDSEDQSSEINLEDSRSSMNQSQINKSAKSLSRSIVEDIIESQQKAFSDKSLNTPNKSTRRSNVDLTTTEENLEASNRSTRSTRGNVSSMKETSVSEELNESQKVLNKTAPLRRSRSLIVQAKELEESLANTSKSSNRRTSPNKTAQSNLETPENDRRSNRRSKSQVSFSNLSKDFVVEVSKRSSSRKSSISNYQTDITPNKQLSLSQDNIATEKVVKSTRTTKSMFVSLENSRSTMIRETSIVSVSESLGAKTLNSSFGSNDSALNVSTRSSKHSKSLKSSTKSLISQGNEEEDVSQSSEEFANDFRFVNAKKLANKSDVDVSPFVVPPSARKYLKLSDSIRTTPGSPLKLTGRRTYANSRSVSSIPNTSQTSSVSERRSLRSLPKDKLSASLTPNRYELNSTKEQTADEVLIISSSMENSSYRSTKSFDKSELSSRRTSKTSSKISQLFHDNVSSSSTPYSKSKSSMTILSKTDTNSSADESTDEELEPISPLKVSSGKKATRFAQNFDKLQNSNLSASRRSLTYSTKDDLSRSSDVVCLSSFDDKENSLPLHSSRRSGKSSILFENVKIERRSSRKDNTSAQHQESTEERISSLRRNSSTGSIELTEETVSKSISRRSSRLPADLGDISRKSSALGDISRKSSASTSKSSILEHSSRHDLSVEATPEVNGENLYEKEVTKPPRRSLSRKSFIQNDSGVSRKSHQAEDSLVPDTPILTKTPARKSNISIAESSSSIKGRRSIRALDSPNVQQSTPTTTPKSALKQPQRSRSSFYIPVTEEITPVTTPVVGNVSVSTPENKNIADKDSEFKTPMNTPGLFESIIHSVIRSRKRARESTGSVMKSSKRLKLNNDGNEHDVSQNSLTSEPEVQIEPLPAKSPKNDLTNVRGLKKLMATPRPVKSPKNDLTDIRGVKKLLGTPQVTKSPKNDLTDIRGVKKLLRTPHATKSPKNDLTNIQGVKKLLGTPAVKHSPKNDLTNIRGVKKLLGTPPVVKSPKNDLTDVRGVKKLLGTPQVAKSPKNDLTKVPNLRRLMSPKPQKEPENDLNNISGVATIFNVSGVDNLESDSEGLFDKLVGKPNFKTYRAKSISPSKRATTDFDKRRKTLGGKPMMSPRVERWVEDQTAMTEKAAKQNVETKKKTADKKRGKRIMSEADLDNVFSEEIEEPPAEASKTRSTRTQKKSAAEEPRKTRRNAKKTEEPANDQLTKSENTEIVQAKKNVRGKKATQEADQEENTVEEVHESPKKTTRGRRKLLQEVQINISSPQVDPANVEEIVTKTSSRTRKVQQVEEDVSATKKPTRGRKKPSESEEIIEEPVEVKTRTAKARPKKNADEENVETAVPKTTRGAKGANKEKLEIVDSPAKPTRGRRGQKAVQESITSSEDDGEKNVAEDKIQEPNKVTAIKATRGRRGQKIVAEATSEEDNKKETPVKSTRSRRGQKKVQEEIIEESEEAKPKEEQKPKSPVKKATRSKRGKAAESVEEDIIEVVEEKPKPTGRRRKVAEVESTTESIEEAVVEVVEKKSKPTGRRGKIVAEIEITDDSPKPATKRARKGTNNKENEEEIVESTPQEVAPQKTRGRALKNVLKEDVEIADSPKRPRRGANSKHNDNEETSPTKTNSRSRKVTFASEENPVVEVKRSKRLRK